MLKRHVIKILCVGVVLAGLMYGCGQAQPEAVDADLNVAENVLDAEDEDIASPLVEEKAEKKIQREIEKESETKSQSGASDTEIIGTWAATFDYAALIEMELGNEYADFHEDFDLTIYLDFHDDGTFEMYAVEEEVRPTLQKYFESLARYAADITYEEFEEYFSKAEVDEMIQEEFGMGLYDYLLEQFVDAIDAADITGEMYTKGVYAVEGDHLLMDEYEIQSNIYDIYTIEGDTLTLTLPEGAENDSIGIADFDYPYVFTRVEE